MLQKYDTNKTSECLNALPLTIVGDSTARDIFWALADQLESRNKVSTGSLELSPLIAKHANMTLSVSFDTTLQFIWDPYLNKTISSNSHQQELYIVSTGLWHARHLNDHHVDAFEQQITRVATRLRDLDADSRSPFPRLSAPPRLILLPVSPPLQASLDPERATTLTIERTRALNARLYTVAKDHGLEVMWATLPMTDGHERAFEASGLSRFAFDCIGSRYSSYLTESAIRGCLIHQNTAAAPTPAQ